MPSPGLSVRTSVSWIWPGRRWIAVTVTAPDKLHVLGQQDAQRRAAQPDIAGLLQRRVVEGQHAVRGDQQERRRRIILEPHAAGTLQPGGAFGDAAILGDLHEVRLQRFEAVQIGLDPGDIRLVLGDNAGPGAARAVRPSGRKATADSRRVRRGTCRRMWRVRCPVCKCLLQIACDGYSAAAGTAVSPQLAAPVPPGGSGRTARSPE